MRLLVTGASGYLGRRVVRCAASDHRILGAYGRRLDRVPPGAEPLRLDLAAADASLVEELRRAEVQGILHTAAVNPGGAEGLMAAVNEGGTRRLAAAAAALRVRFLHVSTDVVHDGRRAPYADEAAPSPLGAYARSKAAGEAAVREHLPDALIVRTSLIYDVDTIDHGTAGFAARLAAGEPLRLFTDVLRQPVWAPSLAEALVTLLESGVKGTLNVAGQQVLDRCSFGRRMLEHWKVPGRERLEAVRVADLGLEVPRDLRLALDLGEAILGRRLPGVDEVLGRAQS